MSKPDTRRTFHLRLPARLHAELVKRAEASGRSINQEVLYALRLYLNGLLGRGEKGE